MCWNNIGCDNNEKIFEYLNPNTNVMLSELNNSDRLNVLFYLKKYYLELRSKLGISLDNTFGLEIEFENAHREIIEKELLKEFQTGKWCVVDDRSLFNGGEVNSPKLVDSDDSWIDLSTVCDIVNRNAKVMGATSAHVHIGVQILGNNPKYWANFVKLWLAYENIIFRFLYGEYISPRNGILQQARPIAVDLFNNLDRINDRARKINATDMLKVLDAGENYQERRKRALNFTNISLIKPFEYNTEGKKRTIECRVGNGTFDPIVWQNNVNLLIRLFMYAKSDKFNEDIISKRINEVSSTGVFGNIYKYSRLYYEQAIEFADLIFDNNLDKIYFLRQYIKDGNVSNMSMVKSNNFTLKKCK